MIVHIIKTNWSNKDYKLKNKNPQIIEKNI